MGTGPQAADEIVYRSNLYFKVKNGYAWFGYGANQFDPPQPIPDPAYKVAPYGLSGILIGSFEGPHGAFYYVRLAWPPAFANHW